MEQQQAIDPLDFPLDAMQRLLDAFNDANDQFRRLFKAWDVDDGGKNYFELTDNGELFKAYGEKQSEYFQAGLLKMLAAVKPAGRVQ